MSALVTRTRALRRPLGTLDVRAHVMGRMTRERVLVPVVVRDHPGVGVTDAVLDVALRHTGVERQRDETMTKAVRRDPLRDPGLFAQPLHDTISASLRPATNADIAEFVAGFVAADLLYDVVPALFALDSLGWCQPANNTNPTVADSWYLTAQGRVALSSLSR